MNDSQDYAVLGGRSWAFKRDFHAILFHLLGLVMGKHFISSSIGKLNFYDLVNSQTDLPELSQEDVRASFEQATEEAAEQCSPEVRALFMQLARALLEGPQVEYVASPSAETKVWEKVPVQDVGERSWEKVCQFKSLFSAQCLERKDDTGYEVRLADCDVQLDTQIWQDPDVHGRFWRHRGSHAPKAFSKLQGASDNKSTTEDDSQVWEWSHGNIHAATGQLLVAGEAHLIELFEQVASQLS